MGANVDYAEADAARYCEEANEATLLILKVESWRGVENAEAMLSNEWVDAVVFGPGDLAAKMGVPRRMGTPPSGCCNGACH